MKPKIAIVVVFLIAVAAIVYKAVGSRGGGATGDHRKTATSVLDGGAAKPAQPVELVLEFSTEKKDWLEAAVRSFGEQHPEIHVHMVGKGSLEASEAILEGKDRPTLWSPADSLVANLLASDWETRNGAPLFATSGDEGPQPLLLTPLVFVIWEDRAKVLLGASGGELSWKALHKAIASPKGWPAIGGKPGWGFVKLGHTDPTRSNSGLQTLLLMTLEYFGRPTLEVGDLLDEKYQAWVREIEKGVPRFESSTGTFMTDMIRFGPSKFDIAVVYESLAVSQLANAQGRWGNLRVVYPSTTLWSDHPIVLLDGDWVTPAQRAAARTLMAYLRSDPVQATALRYGFRPASTSVPIRTSEGENPFTKLGPQGLMLELPPAAQPPDGPVVRNLLMMWSRVVRDK